VALLQHRHDDSYPSLPLSGQDDDRTQKLMAVIESKSKSKRHDHPIIVRQDEASLLIETNQSLCFAT
jgi:hypothetical protein